MACRYTRSSRRAFASKGNRGVNALSHRAAAGLENMVFALDRVNTANGERQEDGEVEGHGG